MKRYKISELSKLTQISVRTLQYYDEIGLLVPDHRSGAGHRSYSDENLLLLQQIATLKYLGLTLEEIKAILQSKEFDVLDSLRWQAEVLDNKAQKIQKASNLLKYITTQIEAGQPINWIGTFEIIKILEMKMTSKSVVQQLQQSPKNSELGHQTVYDTSYNPERLFPIPRKEKRLEIGIESSSLPFYGFDSWTHYEVSWLNDSGKPMVAIVELDYDCTTPYIIESKSLKLYFNSLNNAKFKTVDDVTKTIKQDLEKRLNGPVNISLQLLHELPETITYSTRFSGVCLDMLDIECTDYLVNPNVLGLQSDEVVTETLYSDCLKSNCLVTNQPDWGSVQISYTGKKLDYESLLKYIVSFRNHNEFHEQCIERIFVDIMNQCQPSELSVYGRYTRRGGIDINPFRTTHKGERPKDNIRLIRQ